jgi:hypothetical protein
VKQFGLHLCVAKYRLISKVDRLVYLMGEADLLSTSLTDQRHFLAIYANPTFIKA